MSDELPPVVVLGQTLTPGMVVSIDGAKRGSRFSFMHATTVPSTGALVLHFIGGTRNHETWHSFYPDRVTKVHKPVVKRPRRR